MIKKLIYFFYRFKFYTNLAFGEVGWITNKLPEMMAIVYLLEKFGFSMSKHQIIMFSLVGLGLFFCFGYFWRKIGYYDIEQYVNAKRNPVQHEILKAARKINDDKHN